MSNFELRTVYKKMPIWHLEINKIQSGCNRQIGFDWNQRGLMEFLIRDFERHSTN